MQTNTKGLKSEVSTLITERGLIVIEHLIPYEVNSSVMKSAEIRLYEIFSKYDHKRS